MTLILIIITCVVSITAFNKHELFFKFQFNPYQIYHQKQSWRFFSHALIHADWFHLFVNMFVLYFFGGVVENDFEYYFGAKGSLYFILLYVGGIGTAAIPSFEKNKNNPSYNSVGASGATSAIVFSNIIFSPMSSICLYGVLCFPGILWGVFYLIYSFYMGKKSNDNIN